MITHAISYGWDESTGSYELAKAAVAALEAAGLVIVPQGFSEANTREVERRRAAEAECERLREQIRMFSGLWGGDEPAALNQTSRTVKQ